MVVSRWQHWVRLDFAQICEVQTWTLDLPLQKRTRWLLLHQLAAEKRLLLIITCFTYDIFLFEK